MPRHGSALNAAAVRRELLAGTDPARLREVYRGTLRIMVTAGEEPEIEVFPHLG